MSRRTLAALVLLVAGLLVGAWAVRVATWTPPPLVGLAPDDGYARVSGVVHVHTERSDGTGTLEEIAAAARAAALDFVVVTDHDSTDAGVESGYTDGVLVLGGTEVSTRAGHVLGVGLRPQRTFRYSDSARDALRDVHDLGGVAFAAHPTSPREDFQWTGSALPGGWGLEVWNGDSQWRGATPFQRLRAVAGYPLNTDFALQQVLSSPRKALALWDDLLRARAVPAVAGSDAHGPLGLGGLVRLPLPSYAALFRLARNHILLEAPLSGDAQADLAAVVEGLAAGRAYMSIDALAPAGEFFYSAELDGARWTMGEIVPFGPGLQLRAGGRLPAAALVSLVRDGQRLAQSSAPLEWAVTEPGVYRVEVWLPGHDYPWILSNPIYVFDDETAARRRRQALPPPDPSALPGDSTIDDFDDGTTFALAHDASTRASVRREPASGPDGSASLRMDFAIGGDESVSPYAALGDRSGRDLSGHSGLVLSIRGDDVYRLWIQVRDGNRAFEEGTEWWQASIKVSTDWTRVAVPFDRLRSGAAGSDGHLDLANVLGVFLILDVGGVPPGTIGTIWVSHLGLY